MSFYTRQKSALLPTSLLEPAPSAKTSGNGAVSYVSWQETDRMIGLTSQQKKRRRLPFLAADGEVDVASDGIGYGTH